MKITKKIVLVCAVLICIVVLYSCKTIGELNKNSVYTDILWEAKIKSPVFSSIALDKDRNLYFGTNSKGVYSLRPDGTTRWNFAPSGDMAFHASPTISQDGIVYIGSTSGVLYALDLEGNLKWQFLTGEGIFGTVAIGQDSTIYVPSEDQKLYAIDTDGNMRWAFSTGGRILGSPVIHEDGTIYIGSESGYVYAIRPDGTELWNHQTGASIYNSVALSQDYKTLFVASNQGKILGIDSSSAQIRWLSEISTTSIFSSIVRDKDGNFYIATSQDQGRVYAFSPDGKEIWHRSVQGSVYGTPALGNDGTLYVTTVNKENDKGFLTLLTPDGTIVWQQEFSRDLRTSPVIADDGTVYIGSNIGKVYAIRGKDSGPATHSGAMFGVNRYHTGQYQ